jgi:hypothetical protein
MEVIRHQAVSVEVKREFRFLLSENVSEPKVIAARSKYGSAIIAATDDVVEPSAYFDPRFSGHDAVMLCVTEANVNEIKPDPCSLALLVCYTS